MDSVFTIKVELIIMTINYGSSAKYILSTSDEQKPPCIHLNEDVLSVDKALYKMCEKHIDLDFVWMNPKLITNIVDHDTKEVTIVYGSLIPYDTTLRNNAKWSMACLTKEEAILAADRNLFNGSF